MITMNESYSIITLPRIFRPHQHFHRDYPTATQNQRMLFQTR